MVAAIKSEYLAALRWNSQIAALRLIDSDLWAATQTRLLATLQVVQAGAHGRGTHAIGLVGARRPAWLPSGPVRCGLCDGPLSVILNPAVGSVFCPPVRMLFNPWL